MDVRDFNDVGEFEVKCTTNDNYLSAFNENQNYGFGDFKRNDYDLSDKNDKYRRNNHNKHDNGKHGHNVNNIKNNPRLDPRMRKQKDNYDKYKSQYRVNDDYYHNNHHNNNQIIAKNILDDRKKYTNNNNINNNIIQNNVQQNFDIKSDTRMINNIINHANNNNKINNNNNNNNKNNNKDFNLNTSHYKPVPYMGHGTGAKDTDLETSMIRGMPHNTGKSYGYRNPEEHYYDYIDPDFNAPENTVESWTRGGDATRTSNKKTAKSRPQYARQIY
jgi:hypothetical protein